MLEPWGMKRRKTAYIVVISRYRPDGPRGAIKAVSHRHKAQERGGLVLPQGEVKVASRCRSSYLESS